MSELPAIPDHPQAPLVQQNIWLSHGRFNRLSYLAWSLGAPIPLYTIYSIYVMFVPFMLGTDIPLGSAFTIGKLLLIVALLGSLYATVICGIRRLHDLNKRGWWVLLLLVPLINFFFMLYLMSAKGTPDSNRFGAVRPATALERVIGWSYAVLQVAIIIMIIFVGVIFVFMTPDTY